MADLTPGAENFCEGCRTRYQITDECGTSHECDSSSDCEEYREARIEALEAAIEVMRIATDAASADYRRLFFIRDIHPDEYAAADRALEAAYTKRRALDAELTPLLNARDTVRRARDLALRMAALAAHPDPDSLPGGHDDLASREDMR